MAIPFKTLHFDDAHTNPWGLQMWRFIRRNAEDVYWAPVPRNEDLYRVSRAGRLEGLEGIRQGRRLEVKPYLLGQAARRPSLDETAVDGRGDIGLDMRYNITPNLAAVLTVNKAKAAPVQDCARRLPASGVRANLINSGNANALTGPEGLADVTELCAAMGKVLDVGGDAVLMASTGVIGQRLPSEDPRGAAEAQSPASPQRRLPVQPPW